MHLHQSINGSVPNHYGVCSSSAATGEAANQHLHLSNIHSVFPHPSHWPSGQFSSSVIPSVASTQHHHQQQQQPGISGSMMGGQCPPSNPYLVQPMILNYAHYTVLPSAAAPTIGPPTELFHQHHHKV